MKEITSINDGVRKLFVIKNEKYIDYSVIAGSRYDVLVYNNDKIPLIYSYYNTKHCAMRNLDIVGKPCAITGYYVSPYSLEKMFFYEMTLCEYMINSTIIKAKSFINDRTANLMLWFKNNTTAFIQLHSAKFGEEEFKHEFFNTEGMIADMAVDTVVKQRALNVFLPEGREYYTDSDNELYGLKTQDIDKVYCIYNTFKKDKNEIIQTTKRVDKIIDLIMNSTNEVIEGVDF